MNNKTRAPLVHISRRAALPWYKAWAIRAAAIVLALIVCGVLTALLTGENPFALYASMFAGAFGTSRRVWALLQSVAILLCVSLAVTPAFKMRFWNIGGEGQIMAGCLATAACMIVLRDVLPGWLLIVTMFAASIIAGGIWGLIPAFFKAKWNTNETLFTLMMNYVATQLVAFFIIIWESPKGSGHVGIINAETQIGWFPTIGGNKYILNCSQNVITAYYDCDTGHIRENPERTAQFETLMDEAWSVAKAKNINVTQADIDELMRKFRYVFPATSTTSLQRDFHDGKPTELDMFSGYIIKEADRLNVPVPLTKELYTQLVKRI